MYPIKINKSKYIMVFLRLISAVIPFYNFFGSDLNSTNLDPLLSVITEVFK